MVHPHLYLRCHFPDRNIAIAPEPDFALPPLHISVLDPVIVVVIAVVIVTAVVTVAVIVVVIEVVVLLTGCAVGQYNSE